MANVRRRTVMEVNGQSLDPTSSPAAGALGSQTAQDVAGQYNAGLQTGRGLLSQSDNFNNEIGYGSKAETQAIRQRYAGSYGVMENELKISNLRNASEDSIRNLSAATQAATGEVMQNRQKALLAWQIDQQNRKARGAVLGTVLGITGGVIGAATGGSGGATAGYAAGSGVGNMIGYNG